MQNPARHGCPEGTVGGSRASIGQLTTKVFNLFGWIGGGWGLHQLVNLRGELCLKSATLLRKFSIVSAGPRQAMQNLTDGAKSIMTLLSKSQPPRPVSGLQPFILHFSGPEEKRRSVEEIVAHGLVTIAPNGSLGITPAGQNWNDENLPAN